jgi:FkbM family methyltransferase
VDWWLIAASDMHGINTIGWIIRHPLSKGRKPQNIAHFLSWQVRSRLSQQPRTFELANGSKMLAVSGMTGATGNLYVGLHEFEPMAFLLHFLRADDVFVDVGANVGSYTILAAVALGARVVAFEPGEAFPWLLRNLQLNGLDRVDARREAVGSAVGTVSFTSGLDTMNRMDPKGDSTVPITTLDAACSCHRPALIKIDVEGFEADVLRGGADTLRNPTAQALIMELNDPHASELLGRSGFTACVYDPFTRSLTEDPAPASANGIFVKDISAVRKRVADAHPFSVRGWVI